MIDASAFRDSMATLEAGIVNATAQAVRATVDAAYQSARGTRLFTDRTGALRASVTKDVSDVARGKGSIQAGAKYARWVEDGTRPHEITPRRAGVLVFQVGGATVFAAKVRHPGTAERPFMAQAAKVGEQALEYGLDYFFGAAIERA